MPSSSRIASSHWIFDILRLLAQANAPLGATEIAQKLALPVSTTHRGLATLERSGYIQQLATQKYTIGETPSHLFEAFLSRFPIRKIALPHVLQISVVLRETTSLWIRLGWNAVRVLSAEGPHEIVNRAPVGESCELHESSPGLVFLSRLEKREQNLYFDNRINGHFTKKDASDLRKTVNTNRIASAMESRHAGNGFTTSFPVVCRSSIVAVLSVEKQIVTSSSSEAHTSLDKTLKIIGQLEDTLNKHPELCANPYSHLRPETVSLGGAD